MCQKNIQRYVFLNKPCSRFPKFACSMLRRGPDVELFSACADVEDPCLFDQSVEKLAFGLHDLDNQSRYLYYFRTKWSAPIEFVRSLSLKYPAFEFALHYYDLCGGSCYGDFEVRNGIVRLQNNRTLDEITAYEMRKIDGSQK